MTPAIILLTLCNLALLWRQYRRAQADHAEVWQAIAELRQDHNALALSTADELRFESRGRFELECAMIERGLIKDSRS